ncbi:MAG: hypothetical protein BWY70_01951 [Bacteroidetes bacterium ADurb.Bin408]|nr:MAG: hypothetical protein BWY70_01951 [Bacteroidetes bacterium ADurb.Bin408]
MVNVGDIIAGHQVVKFFKCKSLFAFVAFTQAETVVAFEYLVVGIAGQFKGMVNKPLTDGI